ncbi:MAG: cytochrome c3 family protein [Deltaproteobacteria bacterium]|nr:cytochrome c3 family protein [Deltaproteobacteria bacterium]
MTRVHSLLAAGLLLGACDLPPAVVQPIQFSHKAHIEKGLACDACHQSVEKAAAATVPTKDTCMMCHLAAFTDSPEEEKVRQYADKGEEIPWRRIYQLPDHVYFSHRRHVAVAGVECGQCHGAVASLAVPASYPLVTQSMDWCLACHRTRGATQDCIHCHR